MFDPDQVRRWRKEVLEDLDLRQHFQGYRLSCEVVAVPETAVNSSGPPRRIGEMTPPSAIFGTPFDRTCLDGVGNFPIYLENPKREVFANARIIGVNGLLTENGQLFVGQNALELGRSKLLQKLSNGYFGFFYEETEAGIAVRYACREQPRCLPLNAFFFPHLEGGNFGSFMFRQLPQILAATPYMSEADCYITPGRMSWFEESLRLLGFPSKPIFTTSEICGDIFLSVTTFGNFDAEGFTESDTRDRISDLVRNVVNGRVENSRKLYISRALSGLSRPNYRPMVNELDVEEKLRSRGFSIIYPETLSLREQIRIFASASHIIGPSGSGMFNTMFSPTGARVADIETFHVTVRQHAKLYSSFGHDYAFIFAPLTGDEDRHPIHRRWSLPDIELDQALSWMMG